MPGEVRVVYRFIGGNLALDFANTVHCVGLADPLDELKAADDEWASKTEWHRVVAWNSLGERVAAAAQDIPF